MTASEEALVFECGAESLVGVLSAAERPARLGVLIVVGGPQYRVGSHRQFAMMARRLAAGGVPALRFDYRGMGDSEGGARTFERAGEDIRCAIDRLFAAAPGLEKVVLWGLCDAASAALMYAHRDPRVAGLVLLNPWVRTEQGRARANLRHYYVQRLLQAELWRKMARGELDVRGALARLRNVVSLATGRGRTRGRGPSGETPLPDRMADGFRRFPGKVLFILSGGDFVAQEFKDLAAGSESWQRLLASDRTTRHDLPGANHTFARRDWRDQVERWTESWVKGL